MKTKRVKVFIITLLVAVFSSASVFTCLAVAKKKGVVKTTDSYVTLEQDVYYPIEMEKGKKYPVVFMLHNGGADKSAWGDFPQDVANEGFFTVNITWQAWDTSNVESAINYTLTKYADVIDTNKVVFIGGCHGGKDVFDILNKGEYTYKVATAVLLSVSEIDDNVINSQKGDHAPMLVFYSKNDEIGEYYTDITKKLAEEVVTAPYKVIPQDDPAHGNNMVTKSANKDQVRKDIIDWVKVYTN